MKGMKLLLLSLLSLVSYGVFPQSGRSILYEDVLERVINKREQHRHIDTLYIMNTSEELSELPHVVNGVHIRLLDADQVFGSFIKIKIKEPKKKCVEVYVTDFIKEPDENLVGNYGTSLYVYKVKRRTSYKLKEIKRFGI